MVVRALRVAAVSAALALLTAPAQAAPVTLKLSFVTSDRSSLYQCFVQPFVEAVNAGGVGTEQIKVYFSGALGAEMTEQAQLVRDGAADIAYVVPGYTPRQFPDMAVLELPGLFHNEREASVIFARLVAAGLLDGFRDFEVLGAFDVRETIHSRKPIGSLGDLKGQSIRVNNQMVADALRKLGADPSLLPVNRTMTALSEGKLDGAAVATSPAVEFGFSRLTSHHYLLPLGGAPIALIMNRATFESLPHAAQTIIRKYSGEWLSDRGAACFAEKEHEVAARLKSDPRRTVVEPSPADLATAEKVFASVVEAWAAESPHNHELLAVVRSELGKLRAPAGPGK